MITIKSNIEFLTKYIEARKQVVSDDETNQNLAYAIETLKEIQRINDVWDETRIENIGRNGATGAHYE